MVCIVDTSILVELLNVPGLAAQHEEALESFKQRQRAREQFLLPLAVLIETGNHVAQVANGDARRKAANGFVEFARSALGGRSPFVPTPLPVADELSQWLDDFPDHAMRQIGLADRSLIALWDAQREIQPHRRIYIWALDDHLMSYDTGK